MCEGVPAMSHYVIVRGALGVGKTTVAKALAETLGGRVISIDAILDQHNLEEWDEGYISLRSFLRANDFAIAEAEPLLRKGVPVVFDGNFYYRGQIDDLAGRLVFPHAVCTLKAPLSDCIDRDRRRELSYGEEAVREVFAKVGEVEYGVDLDARRPVSEVVPEIVALVARLS